MRRPVAALPASHDAHVLIGHTWRTDHTADRGLRAGALLALCKKRMIYRKVPPQAPRMLLRVVAAAGASAVLGAVACGGKTTSGAPGFVNGVITYPTDAGDESEPCAEGCGFAPGSMAYPDADNSPEGSVGFLDSGLMTYPEGGDETTVCNGFCVSPEGGSDGSGGSGDGGTD